MLLIWRHNTWVIFLQQFICHPHLNHGAISSHQFMSWAGCSIIDWYKFCIIFPCPFIERQCLLSHEGVWWVGFLVLHGGDQCLTHPVAAKKLHKTRFLDIFKPPTHLVPCWWKLNPSQTIVWGVSDPPPPPWGDYWLSFLEWLTGFLTVESDSPFPPPGLVSNGVVKTPPEPERGPPWRGSSIAPTLGAKEKRLFFKADLFLQAPDQI